MSLINLKVELKLRWKKYFVLSVFAAPNDDNTNPDPNNIIFTIKDIKLYVPAVTLFGKEKCQNFLPKDLIDWCVGVNIKQKVRLKMFYMSIDIFSNQTL